jgi:hypothetical protein
MFVFARCQSPPRRIASPRSYACPSTDSCCSRYSVRKTAFERVELLRGDELGL